MIDSLLVANRGEIAVRILRTCARLGIRSVAVYSDSDAQALHVALADEAYRIGPPPATDSYLNQAAILHAARASNATAIHPGYGFLAENADFAQAVLDAGLVWVGPPPAAMRALGDKARAKALAEQYGVPLLPGYHGDDQSTDVLAQHANRIGYPVLIKASAGGGGRGMRVVESAADFATELEAARREARGSFGDDRVLLERYVRRPRHVEIQIFGDSYGKLIHLGERECSIQRRHQKLIEESPSPAVDADLRSRMAEAALQLARATGYTGAGTVEFLLDDAGQFAFLEVNARLQVEHPVTEAVSGLDLVELQLRVAAGEPLSIDQADVHFDGHALEVRVIAEDALAGFLPSSGTLERFACPPDVRVDTWVGDGTRVSPYYDSLLAKVIAHAPTRAEAIGTLASALREMQIDGVKHNVDLLLACLEEPAFKSGDLHTGFLDQHRVVEELSELPSPALAAVSALDALSQSHAAALDGLRPRQAASDPWRERSVWRIGRLDQPSAFLRAGRPHAARVSAELGGDGAWVDDGRARLLVRLLGSNGAAAARVATAANAGRTDRADRAQRWRLSVDGHALTVWAAGPDRRVVEWQGRGYRLERQPALAVEDVQHDRGAADGAGRLTAPMPGRVVKISVEQGQHVDPHQPLVVLEAMKMEHVLEAPHGGVVTELCVEVGQQVTSGAQLLVLGSTETPEGVE